MPAKIIKKYKGEVYLDFTILTEPNEGSKPMVRARCRCGNVIDIKLYSLISQKVEHCGCKEANLIGTKINSLTVTSAPFLDYTKEREFKFLNVECDCGNTQVISYKKFLEGEYKACKLCTKTGRSSKPRKVINYSGKKIGGYLVLTEPDSDGRVKAQCVHCNMIYSRSVSWISSALPWSCGCISRKKSRHANNLIFNERNVYKVGQVVGKFKLLRSFQKSVVVNNQSINDRYYEVLDDQNQVRVISHLELINQNC